MKHRLLYLAATVAATASLSAAEPTPSPQPTTTPVAESSIAMPVIHFVEYDLPNGLHVILHQNKATPVVATYVLYHVGSKNERPDRTGFAHFFEHLMFEGSKNIPRGQIDKLISAAGGNLNASTSFDRTDYYFNLPSNQLGLGLWVESERMLHAQINETGVETQRSVVKEERRRSVDNAPYGTVFENLAALVFKGTPYAWTPIGSVQYIDQATIDEFRDFYRRYYVPNNATLVIAGDFEIEPTKKMIEEYFGPIPRGKEIERPDFVLQPQEQPEKKVVSLPTTPLPATIHAWRGPQETSDDAPALEMLAGILATGRSSRLYDEIVRKAEAANDVSVFPYLLENGGVIGLFVVGNPDSSLEELDKLVEAEIAKVRDEGVTAEELQKAKNQKISQLASAYGTMARRASVLADFHVMFGDTGKVNRQLERIEGVTREAVQEVARKYLDPQKVNLLHYPVAQPAAPSENAAK
ncbi:MAG TPA: pitrilysin family protein [Chthoniobacteraceae bacterium]|nr:pitrilysin family protein [Chthoniobacteraceae bacterium]